MVDAGLALRSEHHAVNYSAIYEARERKKEQIALLSHLPTFHVPFSDVNPALLPDLTLVLSSMLPSIEPWFILCLCL